MEKIPLIGILSRVIFLLCLLTNLVASPSRCEYIKKNPDPKRWWFGQTFLMLADGFDQTESKEFLSLKCPILVISGSEDLECLSTDRLIQKVNENEQDVTYLKIEGMGHDALEPKWKVIEYLQSKSL